MVCIVGVVDLSEQLTMPVFTLHHTDGAATPPSGVNVLYHLRAKANTETASLANRSVLVINWSTVAIGKQF